MEFDEFRAKQSKNNTQFSLKTYIVNVKEDVLANNTETANSDKALREELVSRDSKTHGNSTDTSKAFLGDSFQRGGAAKSNKSGIGPYCVGGLDMHYDCSFGVVAGQESFGIVHWIGYSNGV